MKKILTMTIILVSLNACTSSNEVQCAQPYTIISAMYSNQLENSQSTENQNGY